MEIPNSVTSIGKFAFYGCSSLTSVTIPSSVTRIGEHAFYGCPLVYAYISDLKAWCNIYFESPDSNPLGYVHVLSFGNGIGVANLIIPKSVRSISAYAFYGCWSLMSVEIPNTVTSIGEGAFAWCSDMTSIIVEEGGNSKVYDSRDNCNAIIETASNALVVGCKNTTIPNSVTSIGSYAFYGSSGLTSVDIPNSVTSIGSYAFAICDNLTSIEIPSSVTSIGEGAFAGCTGLTSVVIPNSVTSIGEGAFNNCDALTSVTVYHRTPLSINLYTFSNRAEATLYVPYGCKEAYEEASYWQDFKLIVEMEAEKCATPTIAYVNGKLDFTCETEGVEYVYYISSDNTKTSEGKGNPLSSILRVNVYATKEGYLDSDVATIDIDFNSIKGDANGDGEITISDVVSIVNTILGNNGSDNARMKK